MRQSEFSRKQRAEMFLRAGGKCELCGMRLKTGEGEYDHVLCLALGGESDISNGQLLCAVCHREKTHSDVITIRKADRMRDKHNGTFRKGRSQWGYGGKFRKKMNGDVERIK